MEYVDTKLNPINENLKSDFLDLRSFLSAQDKSGNLLLLYRGEEQRNIRRRLTDNGLGIEVHEVLQRAFYFGDKARHFFVDTFDGNRNFLTGINDCSDKTISFIYNRICNVLEERDANRQIMKNTSIDFRDFFFQRDTSINSLFFLEKTVSA